MAAELTVLTFNLWGIFNAEHRTARMIHFASKVKDYDIILLQEQFSESDFELICRHIPEGVRSTRYFRRYPTAFYGSGVAVISRFPIKSSFFHVFPLQGYPERVLHGDYYANKGVARLCVSVPCDPIAGSAAGNVACRDVIVYCTHLVAMYQVPQQLRDWRDELYLSVRLSQAISFANYVVATSRPCDPIIIGGDFNSALDSMEIRTLRLLLKIRGYNLHSALPVALSSCADMTEEERRENLARITYSHENMFTTAEGKLVSHGAYSLAQIDHLFVSHNTIRLCSYEDCPDAAPNYPFTQKVDGKESPCGVVVFTRNDEVTALSPRSRWSQFRSFFNKCCTAAGGQVTARDRHAAEVKCPLSDHYGVAARLQLVAQDKDADEEFQATSQGGPAMLTTEEEESLLSVISFFELSMERLRQEYLTFLLLGIAAVIAVFFSVVYILRRSYVQMDVAHSTLEGIVSIFRGQGGSLKAEGGVAGHAVEESTSRVARFLHDRFYLGGAGWWPGSGAISRDAIDYRAIASSLVGGGGTDPLLLVIIILGPIFGVNCLLIALLNRMSYVKIIKDQVAELRSSFVKSSERNNK
ncbi:unnamed protein product [Trypanosoma congolense IL3000]|uniref:WGS project CAEQ00000000 data, annotated contig 698 n=1 Tax=Trypanosoma congolense (strain IL3000) TaxID=1068625 RepID=F9WHW0_TRYCI|nr:unnamed protein product [Trypanosoma congolense IL3000]